MILIKSFCKRRPILTYEIAWYSTYELGSDFALRSGSLGQFFFTKLGARCFFFKSRAVVLTCVKMKYLIEKLARK